MADFVQTMRDWKRMCNAMGQEDEYTACDKCDLKPFGCPAIYEKECDGADWKHVEEVVTAWAAEHPEPVYPTWGDYITKLVIHDICDGKTSKPETVLTYAMNTPIPSDIAQKLGIEPMKTENAACGKDYCELE